MPNATFMIAIGGDDKTLAATKSAIKNINGVIKVSEQASVASGAATKRVVDNAGAGIIRIFGQIEKAAARAFGAGGGGIIARMGAVGEASSAMGTGLGQAAVSGGVLSAAIGTLGVVGAATIGVLAGVAAVTDILMRSWASGISGASRFADTMGIATKALQEFQGAGERLGIDKNAAGGALGNLSQTLNDARFGRNNAALRVLMRLGVGLKAKADGTVDTEAMLPGLADAIARQNSSGRRTAASGLGIPLEVLPMFAQGGKALSADMAGVGRYGAVASDAQIAKAREWQRHRVMVGQMIDRGAMNLGEVGADHAGGILDKAVIAGRAIIDTGGKLDGGSLGQVMTNVGRAMSDSFLPGAKDVKDGGSAIERAAAQLQKDTGGGPGVGGALADLARGALGWLGGKATSITAGNSAAAAARYVGGRGDQCAAVRSYFESRGWSRAQADGIVANLWQESMLNPAAVGDGGTAYGIGQWHAPRQADFARVFGHNIHGSSLAEQLAFAQWELANTHAAAGRALRGAGNAYDAGAIVSRGFEAPGVTERDRAREAANRGRMAELMDRIPEIPVRVEVHIVGGRPGDHVKVTAGRKALPAVSHAFQH